MAQLPDKQEQKKQGSDSDLTSLDNLFAYHTDDAYVAAINQAVPDEDMKIAENNVSVIAMTWLKEKFNLAQLSILLKDSNIRETLLTYLLVGDQDSQEELESAINDYYDIKFRKDLKELAGLGPLFDIDIDSFEKLRAKFDLNELKTQIENGNITKADLATVLQTYNEERLNLILRFAPKSNNPPANKQQKEQLPLNQVAEKQEEKKQEEKQEVKNEVNNNPMSNLAGLVGSFFGGKSNANNSSIQQNQPQAPVKIENVLSALPIVKGLFNCGILQGKDWPKIIAILETAAKNPDILSDTNKILNAIMQKKIKCKVSDDEPQEKSDLNFVITQAGKKQSYDFTIESSIFKNDQEDLKTAIVTVMRWVADQKEEINQNNNESSVKPK